MGFDAAQWAHSSTDDLTAFFDRVDYPLYVVTVRSPAGEMSGCLAGSSPSAASARRISSCASRRRTTRSMSPSALRGWGCTCWAMDQADLARLFGEETGDLVDKFAAVDWRLGSTGAPLLVDTAVSMEGEILGHFSVGDHEAFFMRAVRSVAGGRPGILTYRGIPPLEPGHPA